MAVCHHMGIYSEGDCSTGEGKGKTLTSGCARSLRAYMYVNSKQASTVTTKLPAMLMNSFISKLVAFHGEKG